MLPLGYSRYFAQGGDWFSYPLTIAVGSASFISRCSPSPRCRLAACCRKKRPTPEGIGSLRSAVGLLRRGQNDSSTIMWKFVLAPFAIGAPPPSLVAGGACMTGSVAHASRGRLPSFSRIFDLGEPGTEPESVMLFDRRPRQSIVS